MKGIKMKNCRFYVDEPARTVVCVIPYTRDMVSDFIAENCVYGDMNFWTGSGFNLDKKIRMPNSFMGKAVCAPEDEWNEDTGKLIAFSRAKDKCYKSFFKRANLFVQTVDRRLGDMIESFNDFGLKLEDKREGLQQKINEKIHLEEE